MRSLLAAEFSHYLVDFRSTLASLRRHDRMARSASPEGKRRHLTVSADVHYYPRVKSQRVSQAGLKAAGIGAFFRSRDSGAVST